jgi:hypothetical protein
MVGAADPDRTVLRHRVEARTFAASRAQQELPAQQR